MIGGTHFDPQSLNRYSYVLNNPMTLIDPDGYSSELPCNFGGSGLCIGEFQDPNTSNVLPAKKPGDEVPVASCLGCGSPLGVVAIVTTLINKGQDTPISTTDPVLATLPPSMIASGAAYAWSGIKRYAFFQVGMTNQWMPATKWARNGVEWAIGREIIDEDSTAYKAGGWYFFAVQTVASGTTATSENLGVRVTTPVRDKVFRWGIGSFKLHSGERLNRVLHFHLGPGKGLMKHHLPYQLRGWRGNLWNNLKK